MAAEAAGLRHYLHGVGRGPSASGVPEPLLTELRMSEILGAGVDRSRYMRRRQARLVERKQASRSLPPQGLSQHQGALALRPPGQWRRPAWRRA